jgi:exopolysaccharide biosynthesis polyprenyl glycosylphosphotransferase
MGLAIGKHNFGRLLGGRLRVPHSFSQKHREVLAEGLFRRFLCWERKKAERSRKSFLLMLLDAERVLQANRNQRALTRILSALSSSTRETDIAGWYREGAVLGVLFTEVGRAERNALQELVLAKVMEALHVWLSAEWADQIRISLHFFPEDWGKPGMSPLADERLYPDLLERSDARKLPHFVKRVMDIVGSLMGLTFFSPLFVVVALAIKLTSKGPILFKQKRVGQYGALFTFLKFRSMECVNDPGIHQKYIKRFIAGEVPLAQSNQGQNAVYKIQQDPRVTRVGKFLRKTSLDELPQLINVLKGEMSLVGPRPPIPYESEVYEVWHRRRVLEAKPGITGLWQVSGRSRLKFNDMVRLDLQYAKTWSIWLDIKILLQTPRAVLFGEGAY